MKKALFFFLSAAAALALAVTALEAAPKAEGTTVKVTTLGYDRGNIPSAEGTATDNWFTRKVQELAKSKFNIDLRYVMVPNASRELKLATLLAAGEAPDLSFSYDVMLVVNYAKNNGLIDLAPYLDKYGDNIKKSSQPGVIEQSKINGKQYRIFTPFPANASVTYVRKDWLDKIGLKPPTSPQEFYQMLKAFKEKDPGRLGDKMMPFAFQANPNGNTILYLFEVTFLQGFLKTPPDGLKLVTPYQLWPETKDAFRYLNRLYNEKLMGEFILDKDFTQFRKKVSTGELGATIHVGNFMGISTHGNMEHLLHQILPDAQFIGIYPWKDPACSEYVYNMITNSPDSGFAYFMPRTNMNPAITFQFLDFLAGEDYNWLVQNGIEGKDYTWVPVTLKGRLYNIGTPIDQAKWNSHNAWTWGQYVGFPLYLDAPDFELTKYRSTFYFQDQSTKDEYMKLAVYGPPATKYARPILTSDEPIRAKNSANLAAKWMSSQAKILLAPLSDFDKVYDEELRTWKAEGGDAMAAEAIGLYKGQYGK
jgi:putative aldouronate transport system substrate-binding protein